MIQIKKKNSIASPKVLINQGKSEMHLLNIAFDKKVTAFEFKKEIYGHDDVKTTLKTLQDNKCCFCESKISHISYGHVEHFRPKGGWIQKDEPLNKPGYFWLAYDWDNLFLACEVCNGRHKKNFFPLIDEAKRAKSYKDDISKEEPVFLHPANDNPEKFIQFNEEIPAAIKGDYRGEQTIEKLGLDRSTLNEFRLSELNKIRDIYELAQGFPATLPNLKNRAKQIIGKYFQESELDSTQYASMLRCFFKKNPIDF